MKALTYPAEQGLSEWLLASLSPYPAKGQLLQDEAVIHSRDSEAHGVRAEEVPARSSTPDLG